MLICPLWPGSQQPLLVHVEHVGFHKEGFSPIWLMHLHFEMFNSCIYSIMVMIINFVVKYGTLMHGDECFEFREIRKYSI